jgi:hypothetical protein
LDKTSRQNQLAIFVGWDVVGASALPRKLFFFNLCHI